MDLTIETRPLLKMLNIRESDIGRFRSCYLSDNKKAIVIRARTGGGNREEYQDNIGWIRSHPNFIIDYDEDFDCTYSNFVFSIPDNHKKNMELTIDEICYLINVIENHEVNVVYTSEHDVKNARDLLEKLQDMKSALERKRYEN